ncbi:MAG: MBL fold metallo-hydrolase [Dehalococcoidia bacterium]|nr:MBL fold metallo-hydrolase [Dehalococcoidia bacterium]MDW8119682.1 MBL fold metallo-hydrolase [Chloroflexota bacterium]
MEIVPGVHLLPGKVGCNVYVLVGEGGLVLVDSGLPWGASRILKGLDGLGYSPQAVRAILLTHGHPDHYGGAYTLQQETGARVYMHRADTIPTRRGDVVPRFYPIPGAPRPVVDGFVEEGQVLPVLGGLRVLHTPGHTPGSVCFLLERYALLFTGDTLLTVGRRLARPLPMHEPAVYMQSLERLALLAFERVCPGHGRPLLEQADERLRGLVAAVRNRGRPGWRRWVKWVGMLAGLGEEKHHR